MGVRGIREKWIIMDFNFSKKIEKIGLKLITLSKFATIIDYLDNIFVNKYPFYSIFFDTSLWGTVHTMTQ